MATILLVLKSLALILFLVDVKKLFTNNKRNLSRAALFIPTTSLHHHSTSLAFHLFVELAGFTVGNII